MNLDQTQPSPPLKRIGRIAALTLYTLICCEIVLRILSHFVQIYDIEMLHYAKDLKVRSAIPGVSHQHRPNASARLMGVDVKLNSLGHRSPELATPKPPREKRIHFIGSSITLGWGVAEKDTFVSRVGERFNREVSPRTGYRYAAINAGIGNYNTYFDVELFKRQVDRTQPDIVVMQYYLNDAEVKPPAEDSPLLEYSEFAAFAYQRLKVLAALKRESLADYYRALNADGQPGWEQAKASLAELKGICAARHIPLVVVLLPEFHNLAQNGPYPPIYAHVEAAIAKLGIDVVDTYPRLRDAFAAAPTQAWIARDDPHPGAAAHHIIADALFEDLSRRRF